MPQRMTIPFVGQTAKARSVQVNNQETLNLITSIKGEGAKARVILESAPGLVEQDGAIGDGACRTPEFKQWRHPVDDTTDTYAVFGNEFVRIAEATGVTVIGTLQDGLTTCRIARGRTHIMVVDGSYGYTYDGTTFAQISDADFPDADSSPEASPTHVLYQDTYFIVNDALSDNFYISDEEDPDAWNALDFEAAAVAPDNALAMANNASELWIIGDETAQAYYNSGNSDFPYAIILSATQDVGILAPQSIAESDAGIFFIGTTPEGGRFVYRIQGQSGRIISGEEQETTLSECENIESATGYIYSQAGKSFYVMHLEDDRASLVFNIRAGAWESRSLIDGTAYRINGAGIFNGTNIGGSRFGAIYYELSLTDYSDSGTEFLRRRRTQIIHKDNSLLDWWEIVVDCQSGVGNDEDPGQDPQVALRYSDDGGVTWSQTMFQPLGKKGERERRAIWRSLGQSRNRMFEVWCSDQVEFTIFNAYAVVEVLND